MGKNSSYIKRKTTKNKRKKEGENINNFKTVIYITVLIVIILSISSFNYLNNTEVFKANHIELVDSVEYPPYIDIDVVTSEDIKERIRIDNRMQAKKKRDERNREKEEEKKKEKVEHILLIGIDSRTNDFKYARADTIIIASINENKKQVNLTSIMRDTYVKIPGHKNNRINAAYAFGGGKLLKETINENFNLNIDKYIVINFQGFERVIDILDGIDVNIKKYEVKELNRCLTGLGRSKSYYINQSGVNHLNGMQALAYCRIRKVGKGDYERTERQRKVIKVIIEKIRSMNFSDYPKIIANIYPSVKTNMTSKECLKLIYNYYNISDWIVESMQIPTNECGKPRIINSMWVIDPDLEECIKCIKEFIY
ncbi:LCP family protein [Maledivibacter halophilus]|uniref:Transcriptional attenuator, LytR family n=1 Tax=Maledivibacter halophilus TaxID=36842 RepID=A0A1T5J679_9FIRM|nr:LCP family protein [Maledivibacter halophilus]SKC46899.1 transcriptional attenuator, LytR family [Maledivibacter halophilus]